MTARPLAAPSLVVLSEPTPEDIAALEDGLYGFNVAATGTYRVIASGAIRT